jgi:hypothetical protein
VTEESYENLVKIANVSAEIPNADLACYFFVVLKLTLSKYNTNITRSVGLEVCSRKLVITVTPSFNILMVIGSQ